jgi:hypothetical protein
MCKIFTLFVVSLVAVYRGSRCRRQTEVVSRMPENNQTTSKQQGRSVLENRWKKQK